MASRLKNATLTVQLNENINMNTAGYTGNSKYGHSITRTYTGINEFQKIITTATTSAVDVLTFASARAGGTVIVGDVKYLRVTNLDTSTAIRLQLSDSSNDHVWLQLDPGKSFMMTTFETGFMGGNALSDLATIAIVTASGTADCEVVVASA